MLSLHMTGTVPRNFQLQVFFHETVSPKPLSISVGPFRIFGKFAEIFAAQGEPPVSRHRWQMEKIPNDPIVIFRGLGEDKTMLFDDEALFKALPPPR
jgi:hypothetical protein